MIDAKDYPNRSLGRKRLAPADAVDRQVVWVNFAESPLSWLFRRGLVSERQLAAGERLRADHHRASLPVRVTMRWDPVPTGAGTGAADRAALGDMAARARFQAALDAVGRGLADILWRVVCEGQGLAEAERGLGWPVRSGKLVLGIALDRLADHYENRYGQFSS
ncbi:DUF6456 domain-containing protein [Thermaurantiacus sp.]